MSEAKNLKKTNNSFKIIFTLLFALAALILAAGLGSVRVTPAEILAVIANKLFARPLPENVTPSIVSIIWDIRLPRAITAFIVGAMLSVSGAVVQALLQNPLASSYTLGVSSGASLGAALVIVNEISIPVVGTLMLPAAGFVFGLSTVLLVIFFSARLDRNLRNHTIILFGMIVSLFVNGMLTLLSSAYSQHMNRLVLWQMGSFAGRRWDHVGLLAVICFIGCIAVFFFNRELDLMSFGEEQSQAMGVDAKRSRLILLILSSVLTGAAVCFTGVIGFIDLAAPHAVRRIFGSSHKYVLPMSAVAGGSFMTLADLASRTVLSPQEIPVGAVTALLGAPFFLWVYFGTRRKR